MEAAARAPQERKPVDTQTLFARWKCHGDGAAREELVRHFLPLARKLARRYARSSEPYEDLAQVASLALVKAIERFDPDRGISFAAFATPTILGDLRRYFRDCCWSVHVPRGAQERALAVAQAAGRLTRNGRSPTVHEIAQYLELSVEDVLDGLFARQAYDAQSFESRCDSDADSGARTIGETVGVEDERYELVEADVAVSAAIRSITKRERDILRLRFVEELTQNEIAARVGVSQMQISRMLRRALERLRELAGAKPAVDG